MSGAFDLCRSKLPKGTLLLEASAGTGKTYTITGVVLRLLLEGLVDGLPQVLVVTFTVAATEELKARLRRALADGIAACEGAATGDPFLQHLAATHGAAGAQVLRRALAQADEMSVATIHGFCRRVLEEAAFESGLPFATEFDVDEVPMLAEAARDAVRIEVLARSALAAAVAREADLLPEVLLTHYRQFRRHSDTALLPPPEPVDSALRHAEELVAEAHRLGAAGDLPLAALQRLRWKANRKTPLAEPGGPEALLRELQRRLADPGDPCLDWLLALAPARLRDDAYVRDLPPLDHRLFALCGELVDAVARAGHALRARLFAAMDLRVSRHKRTGNSLTFQDLLDEVARALRHPKLGRGLLASIQQRWQAAMIDEFQDTDPLQYEVFATCFGARRLLLVGDPKQSIYGFRGADVHTYLASNRDAKRKHTLGDNYRSHPDLVAATAHLFAGPDAFRHDGIELPTVRAALDRAAMELRGEPGRALQLRWLGPGTKEQKGRVVPSAHRKEFAELRITADVADQCVRLLGSGVFVPQVDGAERPLRAGDLAVLTRTNAQAVAIQEELRRRSVHSAIGKAGDVFQCPEMDDLERLLTALCNPTWLPLLRAAWTTPLFGLDAALLQALDADQDALERMLQQADRWRRTWFRHGFVVMFQDLLDRLDARQRLLRRADGERKLTNYLQIAELLHQAEMARQLAPESLVQWLRHERKHALEIDYELRELRLESDADAVQILTVHGSKGLQYEVVFVPFAWSARGIGRSGEPLLVRREDGSHALDYTAAAGNPSRALAEQEQLEEDLRLLYVAVTRARRRCIVHWAAANTAAKSGLNWLLLGRGQPPATGAAAPWDAVDVGAWRAAADRLADASDRSIEIVEVPIDAPTDPPPVLATGDGRPQARPRPLPAHTRRGFTIASFTSLLAGSDRGETTAAAAEPSADDRLGEPIAAAPPGAASATPDDAGGPTGMFAFARGARAGVCLHEILEHADFAAAEVGTEADAGLATLVRDALRRHGLLAAEAHRAPIDPEREVTAMVQRLGRGRCGALPFRLGELAPGARVPEWQFFLRAGRAAPRALAPLFARHAGPNLQGYADALERLPRADLGGYLRGFVDLLAEHDGRYWVFDWKSNWLGDRADDYDQAALWQCMQQDHYVLQYHLYLLALHRHLRARLAGYDYDAHVGGACYVFLRGLDGPGDGAICDRPPRALIEALDDWLAAEAAT